MDWSLEDGCVYILQDDDYKLVIEFIDSNGRIAFRLYDRHLKGLVITHQSMIQMHKLLGLALERYPKIVGLEAYDGLPEELPGHGMQGRDHPGTA